MKAVDLGQLTFELQTILDGLDSDIFIIDLDYNVKRVNEPARQLAGNLNYRDIVGKKCFEIFFGFNRPCNFCPLTESQELSLQEVSINTSSEITSDSRIFRQKIFPLSFDQTNIMFVEILTDISQEKEKEKENLRNEKLIGLGRAVQAVAHELGNPLMGMQLTINNLLNQGLPEDTSKRVELLKRDVERASRIVEDLRTTTVQGTYPLAALEIIPVIESAWNASNKLYQKEVQLDYEINVSPRVRVLGDAQKIFQVFENLFKNSFEAFEVNQVEKKNIILRANQPDKKFVEIQFIDNAGGVRKPVQNRIFDPFFTTKRFQAATQALSREASGLGLFIVQKIMGEHQGNIEVVSRKPFTRFSLKFRAAGEDSA